MSNDPVRRLIEEIEREFRKDPNFSYFFVMSQDTLKALASHLTLGSFDFYDPALSGASVPSPTTLRRVFFSVVEPMPEHLKNPKLEYEGAIMVHPALSYSHGGSNWEYMDFESGIHIFSPKNTKMPYGKATLKRVVSDMLTTP